MRRKILATLLGAAMLVLPVCGFTGCGGETQPFTYDDGISASGNYDSSVFYRNDLEVDWFADPGVIYAEDGYFYAYLAQNPSCYAYGETEEEAYEELYNIADEQNAEYCALRDWY